MTINYNIITPTSLNTKGVIYNISTTEGTAPYTYSVMYNNSVIPFGTSIQGFSGDYIIQVVDSNGLTESIVIHLHPNTQEQAYCISCNESTGEVKQFCNTTNLQSFTVSYTPTYQSWTSFHSYNDAMLTGSNTFYLIGNYNELHKMNWGHRGNYVNGTFNSLVDYVQVEKTISNVNSMSILNEVYDSRGVLQQLDTFDYITVWNQRQCTNRIKTDNKKQGNTRYAEGLFVYNDLRDVAKPNSKFVGHILEGFKVLQSGIGQSDNPNYKSVLNSTYHIARLEFENKWNKKMVLNDVKIDTSQSIR